MVLASSCYKMKVRDNLSMLNACIWAGPIIDADVERYGQKNHSYRWR